MNDQPEQETAGDWYERCLSAIYFAADHDCEHQSLTTRGQATAKQTIEALEQTLERLKTALDDEQGDPEVGMAFVEAFEFLMLACHQRNLRTLTVFFHSVKTFHERWSGTKKARRPDGSPAFPTLDDE